MSNNSKIDKGIPNEKARWWIERAIQFLSILAPFILAFWLLIVQGENQRHYEREKLIQLLQHIEAEITRNNQFIRDSTTLPNGMGTKIEMLKDGRFISNLPQVRFKTVVWETANLKDYFFLIRTDTYNEIERLYGFFYEYNKHVNNFAQSITSLKSLRASYKILPPDFQVEWKNAIYHSKSANEYVDKIPSQSNDVVEIIHDNVSILRMQ